ncbi:MAG: hypothetical protein JXB36_18555 [Gammaproteobacteria bacterium]|nr:hypothetical protein [Gammaproteobacteria bacterium]
MYRSPSAPQSIGGVLDAGFALFRESFKSVFFLAVAGGLVSAPANRILQAVVADGPGFTTYVNALLITAVMVVVTTLFMAVIVWLIDRIGGGERPAISQAFAAALRRVPALIGAGILYFLAVMVGTLLLLVPGIWVGVALLFFYMAIIVDGRGPIEGLGYSWQLVRGNWWRTAALVTIISIVLMILYLLLGIVVGVVVALGTDVSIETGELPWYIDFIATPLITGVVGPLGYALFMSVYRDLKLRREGGDIAERIAAAEA